MKQSFSHIRTHEFASQNETWMRLFSIAISAFVFVFSAAAMADQGTCGIVLQKNLSSKAPITLLSASGNISCQVADQSTFQINVNSTQGKQALSDPNRILENLTSSFRVNAKGESDPSGQFVMMKLPETVDCFHKTHGWTRSPSFHAGSTILLNYKQLAYDKVSPSGTEACDSRVNDPTVGVKIVNAAIAHDPNPEPRPEPPASYAAAPEDSLSPPAPPPAPIESIPQNWSTSGSDLSLTSPTCDCRNQTCSITSPFASVRRGLDHNQPHRGTDIAGGEGTPIISACDGVVKKIHRWKHSANGYGVVVDCGLDSRGRDVTTIYIHMKHLPAVDQGQRVSRGDFLGFMGHTGEAEGTNLHFQVDVDGTPHSPYPYSAWYPQDKFYNDPQVSPSCSVRAEREIANIKHHLSYDYNQEIASQYNSSYNSAAH